ncbi:MAG: hypothetical protein AB8G05_18830 [Oligoflexales bacterium]
MLLKCLIINVLVWFAYPATFLVAQDFPLDLEPIKTTEPTDPTKLSKKKKRKKEKKKNVGTILYEVTLDSSVENSTIYKKYKKKMIFKTESFTEKVKKYSIFLVLNEEKTGVIAELVVTKVRNKKKKAYARVTRIIKGLKKKDLVNKIVIRFYDLKKVLGNNRIFHENSIVGLAIERASYVMPSINAVTQSKQNAIAYSTGASIKAFMPVWQGLEWVNWFGLRGRYHQNSTENINFRLPAETVTRNGSIGGSWSSIELLVQPWFRVDWIHHVTLGIGVINSEEQLNVEQESDAKTTYLTTFSPSSVHLGFTFNPAFNFFLGARYTHIPPSPFKVKLNSDDSLEGNWGVSMLHTFGQILQPVSENFKIDGIVSFTKRDDLIKTKTIGESEFLEQKVSDWGYTLSIGVVYSP